MEDSKSDFRHNLKKINKEDWDRLFSLIPAIETTSSFGEMIAGEENAAGVLYMPYMKPDEIVHDFFSLIHQLNLVPIFDWVNWKEGRQLVGEGGKDLSSCNAETLCRLFTVMIRTDRFSEGFLVQCFENGTVLNVLKALKKNITLL